MDLPALTWLLSQPIRAVEVALPASLGGAWPWPSKVRTHFAAIRTDGGSLLFHYGAIEEAMLDGIETDDPFRGYTDEGMLTMLPPDSDGVEADLLARPHPLQSPEPLEWVRLDRLFPTAGRVYVPGATACELCYTHVIRDGSFRLGVSGIRLYSVEATTVLERATGGVLECCIRS